MWNPLSQYVGPGILDPIEKKEINILGKSRKKVLFFGELERVHFEVMETFPSSLQDIIAIFT